MSERTLSWEGCRNARDLGGLRTRDGGETRRGALVRAGAIDALTEAGWSALRAHGIRTVVDLRNEDERGSPPRAELATVQLPLDGIEDAGFWGYWASGPQFGTPLYYRPFLDRFPERVAGVIAAVARARPGGVLVHCAGGRDRTGLVAMLLLALVGVQTEDIAADYALSCDGPDMPEIEEFLRREGTSAPEAIVATLASLDVEAYLLRAGLGDDDLAALRARLVAPAP